MANLEHIIIRNGIPSDYEDIIQVMPDWWDGRDLRSSILKIFFHHFNDTIFIAERDGKLVGFLIGFLSQSKSKEAYIHFAGIHPKMRKIGLGHTLFQHFFSACKEKGCTVVCSCTSIVNKGSVEFHKRIGFSIEPGDEEIEGIPVTNNYLRPNHPMVLFRKELNK